VSRKSMIIIVGRFRFSNEAHLRTQLQQQFWRFSSRNRVGNEPHPLTLARRNLILELWSGGMTQDEIAAAADLDFSTVVRHLREARRAGDARAIVRHPGFRKEASR
jgi:DNA-binding CsgD family transcriptional regulator